jgi:hypothetical protein
MRFDSLFFICPTTVGEIRDKVDGAECGENGQGGEGFCIHGDSRIIAGEVDSIDIAHHILCTLIE